MEKGITWRGEGEGKGRGGVLAWHRGLNFWPLWPHPQELHLILARVRERRIILVLFMLDTIHFTFHRKTDWK